MIPMRRNAEPLLRQAENFRAGEFEGEAEAKQAGVDEAASRERHFSHLPMQQDRHAESSGYASITVRFAAARTSGH